MVCSMVPEAKPRGEKSMMIDSALDRLARLYGIEPEYRDIWGKRRVVSDETKLSLLRAMGLSVEHGSDISTVLAEDEARSWRALIDPVHVVRQTESPIRIHVRIPDQRLQNTFEWTLIEEDGKRHGGVFVAEKLEVRASRELNGVRLVQCACALGVTPGPGYHWVEIRELGDKDEAVSGLSGRMRLIVTPEVSYMPLGLKEESRVWGPAIQLYALCSGRNWGIGDFTDLKTMAEYCAEAGAGILGLNPLHSLFPSKPEHCSPYDPSSRVFINFLYLDIEAIADFAECEAAKSTVQSPEFQARLAALRDTELVDYSEVTALKRPILEILFRHFRGHHLESESERGRAFRAFQVAGGQQLHAYGVFEAMQEHFSKKSDSPWGWRNWPEEYRDPQSQAVAKFAFAHQDRVEFFHYLQWQADLQLGAVGHLAMELDLKVGLYEDLAVGADSAGFETWIYQDVYALGARIGAPPDDFNLNGQDWGLSPMIPMKLVDAAYGPFIETLRSNMRYAGAVRVDHVMQLMRLFWVPPDRPPSEGAYVHYPMRDLLGILALESQRNRCVVIGEDLGTVPDEIRAELRALGVLSYRLLYFEKDSEGNFTIPDDYPEQALVAVSTHDLPTLSGYWQGQDLAVRTELGLFPTEELRETQIISRSEDRFRLLFALKREELLPEGVDVDGVSLPEMSSDLITAIHVYLARSPAKILVFQLEDILGQVDQVNLPGTTIQHPNWQRKLPTLLESFSEDARLENLVMALRLERGLGIMPQPSPAWQEEAITVLPRVPVATYRLQFNKDFTFSAAADVVAYLRHLGVSHCYTSPYLKARPGSTHGYDIVDHTTLNPELGTGEDFEHFVNMLYRHGMGQILDIVPNHMAAGCDNPWWVDILENGQASPYADFFDVAWHSLKDELRGKVLLPLLEDHYGLVLEKGLLRLAIDAEMGEFNLWYHEHRFPIDPGTYPLILSHGLERLELRIGAKVRHFLEFQSLVTAFENLPKHWETEEEKVTARNRDKEIQKRQLARLCRDYKKINRFLEENVVLFNGVRGEPESFDLLHNLLQFQAYRLAYWRVAADEINYRRFFDINELAGLRMENRTVFEATHQFVLDLVTQGKIQGLRVDHIDGLYDPQQYCHWLLEEIRRGEIFEPDVAEKRTDAHEALSDGDFFYLVVEKILADHEQLPTHWPVQGTTGYDFANLVGGLFVESSHERDMDRIYTRFLGRKIDFDELLYECKKLTMRVAMASELGVLTNELNRIAESCRHTRDFTLNSLRDALTEVVACFPVYRTYVTGNSVTVEDRRYVDWAISRARKRSRASDTSIYDFIRRVLLLDLAEKEDLGHSNPLAEFTMRFQQFTGPAMAKGLEDTSFYIYNRLLCLNEVGGDPRRFGVSVSAFHHANRERALRWPYTMLGTSTHDSKLSEDVRARISVLSEIPEKWQKMLTRWSRLNRPEKQKLETRLAPSKNDEYALYQILISAWPFAGHEDHAAMTSFRDRIESYMIKAVREAKVHSSWVNPNSQYEEAVIAFVRGLLDNGDSNRFLKEFLSFQRHIARVGMFNSLSQVLLKLTSPGVPDIYQGSEVWNFALVDPDNRRPVDFARRRDMLEELESFVSVPDEIFVQRISELLETMEDGRIKLYITWKTLALRREYEDVFRDGTYLPLAVHGKKAENLCAFARQYQDEVIVVVAPRLYVKLCGLESELKPLGEVIWIDTWLEAPPCPAKTMFRNVFTGEILEVEPCDNGGALLVAPILGSFPVALLTKVRR